jgi:hypothetical protein
MAERRSTCSDCSSFAEPEVAGAGDMRKLRVKQQTRTDPDAMKGQCWCRLRLIESADITYTGLLARGFRQASAADVQSVYAPKVRGGEGRREPGAEICQMPGPEESTCHCGAG